MEGRQIKRTNKQGQRDADKDDVVMRSEITR
jgi:hypothetical protein